MKMNTSEFLGTPLSGFTRTEPLRPYIVDSANDGSVVYVCYHPGGHDGKCIIFRHKTVEGANSNEITTSTVTVAAWANRRTVVESEWIPINGSDRVPVRS